MKITGCHIVNFGCLSDRSYSFRDGLNVLYAENGSGKSSLAVFFKAMLYGFPASTKQSLTENERRRYTPWNGGRYGGTLSFEANGKEYLIERFFGAKEREDTFKLYNLQTQKESSDFDTNVGIALFGVDADGFERSLYVSQRAPLLPPKNNTIRAKLGNLLEASDDLGDFEGAYKLLDTARRSYLTTGNRGRIGEIEKEISSVREEIADAETAETKAQTLAERIDTLKKEKTVAYDTVRAARENRAEAERRRLLEEKGASYRRLTEVVENEKRTLLPLNIFFEKYVPTERELAEAELCLQRTEAHEAQYRLSTLSEIDKARLDDLTERYGATPKDGDAKKMRELCVGLRTASDEVLRTEPKEDEEWDALSRHFKGQEPSDADIDVLHKATAAYDEAEADLLAEEALHPKKETLLPLILFSSLSFLSLLLSIIGFVVKLPMLGVAGLVLLFVFSALLFFRYRSVRNQKSGKKAALDVAHAALSSLLSPYAYTEKNPSVCAKLLFKDIYRFRLLRKEKAERSEQHEAARKTQKALAEAIDDLCNAYRLSGTPEEAAAQIDSDTISYTHLLRIKEENEARRKALRAYIDEGNKATDAFLSRFDFPDMPSRREALATVRRNLLLSRDSLARYEEAGRKLKDFLKEADFDPTAPLPPYLGEIEDFVREEKRLTDLLLSLENEITAGSAEAKRLNDIVAEIPVLKGKEEALLKEKAENEHTYSLLDMTREILLEAKESLSTRYLAGIEKHFSEYLSLLSTKDEKYLFDTDLSVFTEREGARRPVEVLSRGEQDMISFCARMSLIESIFKEEVPFLLLDDPFVNLDDKNYERAFDLLKTLSSRFQIFYTVCSQSRLTE